MKYPTINFLRSLIACAMVICIAELPGCACAGKGSDECIEGIIAGQTVGFKINGASYPWMLVQEVRGCWARVDGGGREKPVPDDVLWINLSMVEAVFVRQPR